MNFPKPPYLLWDGTDSVPEETNMMRFSLLLVLILTVSGLACAELNLKSRPEIVDGDTIKVSGNTIRFDGIDAPEKRQQCRDSMGETYNCGVVATEALRTKIAENSVFCEQVEEDYYGRIIGTCYLGELDLNGWMVQQGHALAYRQYSDKYVSEEQEAREAERGLWAGEFIPPWEWRRGKRLE